MTPDRLTLKLVHLYCDGELTPDQVAQLQRCLECYPDDRAVLDAHVDWDRRLKECIRAVIGKSCGDAPEGLSEAIRAAMAQATLESSTGRVLGPSHSSPMARPRRVSFLAIAATLALIGGAVLFGIFGPTIDDVPVPASIDMVPEAALFADRQHGQLDPQSTQSESDQVQARLSEWLGAPVLVFDLSDIGYEFVGGARSRMPVPVPSAHLIYRKTVDPGLRPPMVSLYVLPNREGCKESLCKNVKKGQWSIVEAPSKCSHTVLQTTDGRLVYFLVCCDERDLTPVKQHLAFLMPDGDRR